MPAASVERWRAWAPRDREDFPSHIEGAMDAHEHHHPITRQAGRTGLTGQTQVAIGSAVGTTINYDFLAYGTAAALYFGTAFFPGQDPVAATLLAFATVAVGFAMRPLGGLIGGYLGDKYGRKPVLVGSLLVMGFATFLIGVLPTYQQVGVLAPILVVAIRIIQGLAFGAEWGGAIMMTFEHAPWRQRGRYTGIPQAGVPLGLLLANLVFLATTGWNNEWSWRVPFLASSLLIIAGIIIRMKVSESPEFEETKAKGELVKNPLLTVIKDDWRTILRVIGLRLAESGGFYVIVTYLLSYIVANKLVDRQTGLTGLVPRRRLGCGDHNPLGPAHGPDRTPEALHHRLGRHHSLRLPDVPHGQHRRPVPGYPRVHRRAADPPRHAGRRPGRLVLRAVSRQHPDFRGIHRVPVLGRNLRFHPPHRSRHGRRLGLERRVNRLHGLRSHWPHRGPGHAGNLG